MCGPRRGRFLHDLLLVPRYDPTLDCYFDPLTSKYYELNLAGPGAAAATPRRHQ